MNTPILAGQDVLHSRLKKKHLLMPVTVIQKIQHPSSNIESNVVVQYEVSPDLEKLIMNALPVSERL